MLFVVRVICAAPMPVHGFHGSPIPLLYQMEKETLPAGHAKPAKSKGSFPWA
jgi:hypothetical protein